MNTLAIEINDAELTVADHTGVLAMEPGYAAFVDGRIVTGGTAYAQARIRPRQTSHRYWEELSLDPDSSGIEGVGSSAEFAFAQLESLWKQFGGAGRDAIIIVPGHYAREQLGLLLGLVNECRMPVRGDDQRSGRGEYPALARKPVDVPGRRPAPVFGDHAASGRGGSRGFGASAQ